MQISCTRAECQDPDFGGEEDLLNLMLNAYQDPDFGAESDLLYLMLNTRIQIRWRVGSSVPDAECQDPDFGEESDL
jgi:hypothetical protein